MIASVTLGAALSAYAYLLGSWHCTFTVGARSGTYTTTWSQVLDGRWLQQSINQPATQRSMMKGVTGGTEPGFRATFLVGYDTSRGQWVRFGALSTGQYFPMRMKSNGNGGWAWTYVSFFRNRAAQGPDATLERISDRRYRIDGPTYPDEITHKPVTEHHLCTKT